MHDKLVDGWRVEQRQQIASRRGLNVWPQDEPEDLLQIERIAQWIDALPQPALIEHPLHPLKMWVAPGFSPRMAYYFALGDYEEADLELIEKLIKRGDRVLECGGGAGITGSLAAMCSRNPVTVVEPNQLMHAVIERNVQLNDQRCELIAAAVVANDYVGDELTLHVQAEYWWSSVLDKGQGSRCRPRSSGSPTCLSM
ncbi:hypothetical protein [Halopseudomonas bauzanensis]|uniref:Uncharacterized protein n=1 Tax=Halopseudomonas bauzanensis TaxID=653930 RepID=A0A4U0YF69_9GAMM|nr:hypothetical protein [Halopseudomonas bauzanensis]TKA89685.1 hypothetical protein FA869_15900 [Halopseudomonas bauzanensis]